MAAEGFSFLIDRFLTEARKHTIFKVTLVMLIGLSYIFPVILKKKPLHNRHQPSQHRKPIIIPTSLRPTVESSVVDCRVPSVRSLVPPFRPFVRRPFVCSITDMNLAIIPRHSLWSLCCMLPVPPATCGLCPFFQFVTQL